MIRLWVKVIQTSGTQVYVAIVQILYIAITARFLGPEGRGLFVAASSWVILIATLGSLSLGQVIIHYASGKEPEDWLPENLGTVLPIIVIVTIFEWLIVGWVYVSSGGNIFNHLSPTILTVSFLALPFVIGVEIGRYFLLALNRLDKFNLSQIIGSSIGFITIIILVGILDLGVIGALLGLVFLYAVSFFLSYAFILEHTNKIFFEIKIAKRLLRGSGRLHMNAIGTVLFTHANTLIINHFRSPQETSFFQLAFQLILGFQILPNAIAMVTYALVSQKGPDEAWNEQRKLLIQSLILSGFFSTIGFFVAPLAITLMAGEEFLPSVPLFRILLLGLLGMTFSIVMASQWIGRGLFTLSTILSLMVGMLSVLGNYLVVPKYGMYGSAWTMVFIYMLALVGNGIMALWIEKRRKRNQLPLIQFSKV